MKRVLMLLWLAITVLQAMQAGNIRDFFISEPGELFKSLSQGTRAGMVATQESGHSGKASTRLNEDAEIDTLTADFMRIKTSNCATVELKLLTMGQKDSVIAVIETVKTPVPDSKISFYDTRWNVLKTSKHFKAVPGIKHFVKPGTASSKAKEVLNSIDFEMIELQFAGKGFNRLMATQQLKTFYSQEDYSKLASCLHEKITYQIQGTVIKPLLQQ